MRTFFKEIFEYHYYFNSRLIEQLKEFADALPSRTLPLFSHILNAHEIWNGRILNLKAPGVWEVRPVELFEKINHSNYNNTVKIIETRDLEAPINYATSKGQPFSNSVRDILFHIANHSTHHKGQIVSDLRQSGVEPVKTDFIFFKR